MGGGLLQLVAYGAQDVYLTGNPQITFFKVVYRRHTNFAIESIQQTYNGQTEFGNTINCTVSRNGDLINRVYVEIDVKGLGAATGAQHAKYVNYLGLKLLKNVVVEIGGQQIDKHYSDWMFIWNELSLPIGKRYGYDKMVGANGYELSKVEDTKSTKLYIPLEFWFCRNIGLALPLIALQYHEVKFKIEFSERDEIALMYDSDDTISNSDDSTSDAKVELTSDAKAKIGSQLLCNIYVDYIFLDTDERRKFAQLSHEYLIEQLQFTGEEQSNQQQIRLNFNHPVKELVWVSKWAQNYTDSNNSLVNWNNYSINDEVNEHGKNSFVQGSIKLNGNDRIANRESRYFDLVQPYQHHTNIPKNGGINVYSFALKPEEHQPSGTLNMSRIDSAHLHVKINDAEKKKGTVLIYAINYNVLRILSGMGGLAYSN
tara:strand:- start:1489 stop:2772 length:1284 start_codon:yes stop_codon:yes gene_type:complete